MTDPELEAHIDRLIAAAAAKRCPRCGGAAATDSLVVNWCLEEDCEWVG